MKRGYEHNIDGRDKLDTERNSFTGGFAGKSISFSVYLHCNRNVSLSTISHLNRNITLKKIV